MTAELVQMAVEELQRKFGIVRRSSAVTKEQLLTELQSIPRGKLPAAIVCADGGSVQDDACVLAMDMGFVIVAPFAANMDGRVRGALEALDAALDLFPPGRARRLRTPGGIWADYFVRRFYSLDLARDYAAFAIELELKSAPGGV